MGSRSCRIGGIIQQLPHRLVVPDLDHAARVAGDGLPALIASARYRVGVLGGAPSGTVVRQVAALTDLDFELLLAALEWLRSRDETGLTPRQLQIEGVHGKWLESHGSLVEQLLGRPLRTVKRAQVVSMTWLDPEHRDSGRRHDTYTIGDEGMRPPYPVRLAVLCENKDTVIHFPPTTGAVAIEGGGTSVPPLDAIPWLYGVPIVYWGDIDAAGYRIVHQLRAQGRPVTTILMDEAAADRYGYLGVRQGRKGKPIEESWKDLPLLEPGERAVYERLVEPGRAEWLRVEQERIPFEHALEAINTLVEGGRHNAR